MIQIIGCGEAFDDSFGNNASLLYHGKTPLLLIDCGYQIPERLWKQVPRYATLKGIYFTHTHADHIFGIAALLGRFWEEQRQEPLLIMGPRGIAAYIDKLMGLAYPNLIQKLQFPLRFKELAAGDCWQWEQHQFECARSKHSILNLSVRITDPQGKSVGFSGDGQLTPSTKQLFRKVDLLFHETYEVENHIPNHCNVRSLVEYAKSAEIKAIVLMHIGRTARQKVTKELPKMKISVPDTRWIIGKPGNRFTVGKGSIRYNEGLTPLR